MTVFQHRGLTMRTETGRVEGNRASYYVTALRDGREVGYLGARIVPSTGAIHVETIQVEDKRAGVGTALYEVLAKVACKRGVPLFSDMTRSVFAESFWRKQARKRRAVCAEKNVDRDDNVYRGPALELREKIERECHAREPYRETKRTECVNERFEAEAAKFPKPKGRAWPCLRWKLKPESCASGGVDLSASFGGRRSRR